VQAKASRETRVKPIREMSQAEVGAYVHTHLGRMRIDVVLSGSAAVGIYTASKYVSKNIGLVRECAASTRAIAAAMQEVGFQEAQGRYLKHPGHSTSLNSHRGRLPSGQSWHGKSMRLSSPQALSESSPPRLAQGTVWQHISTSGIGKASSKPQW
jgi:hypothetical protein